MHAFLPRLSRVVLVVSFALQPLIAVHGATAGPTGDSSLTCISEDGTRRHCAGYTGAGVALQESMGTAECLLGRNWGYDAAGVWVTEGCGARFALGNPQHELQRMAAATLVAEPADAVADGTADTKHAVGDYRVYARFGAQTAFEGKEAQVQDARSRLGMEFSSGEDVQLFARAEWSVKLTGTESPFNPGESTSGGFVVLEANDQELFGNRLGYVGVDFGDWGQVTLGKQWSVQYDVTSYTDQFNVFGSDASATFNAGTDGGFMGTGRADFALIYRNEFFDRLELGLQTQLRSLSNDETVDGYAVSLQFELLAGLKVGSSYTQALFDDRLKGRIAGLNGNGEYVTAGVSYASDKLSLASVYVKQENGDLVRMPIVDAGGERLQLPVVFDAEGLELYGRYQLTDQLALLGGYLNYKPDLDETNSLLIDPLAELEYYIFGTEYRWRPNVLAFAEYRLADGYDFVGQRGNDVFVMGLQYWFAKAGAFSYP